MRQLSGSPPIYLSVSGRNENRLTGARHHLSKETASLRLTVSLILSALRKEDEVQNKDNEQEVHDRMNFFCSPF